MRTSIFIFCFSFFPSLLIAQEKLNSLKSPSSPASSVLGLQPTAVLSPKSYQALETALYSNFLNNNSPGFPNDFALEFTPYWATNHSLSLDEYLFPKRILDQVIRNSSFSVASTQNFVLGDSTSTNGLAFGYRTTLYFGNKADREKLQNYEAKSDRNNRIYNRIGTKAELLSDDPAIKNKTDFLEEIKSTMLEAFRMYENEKESERLTNKIISESDSLPGLNKSNPGEFVDAFRDLVDKILEGNQLFNEYKSYVSERQGFAVDIAYANLLSFPTNNFEFSVVPRQSFWISPAYQFKNKLNSLKVMGVMRYEWYNTDYFSSYFPTDTVFQNNVDLGLAVSAELKKFSIQFEFVGKYSKSDILNFMKEVLPALDNLEYVQRYAWFSASETSGPLGNAALFDGSGKLTTLGKFYSTFEGKIN